MKKRLITAALTAASLLPGAAGASLSGVPVAGGAGVTPIYVLGFELGPWQAYLAHELTPAFMAGPDAPPVRVSWLDSSTVVILPAFAEELLGERRVQLHFDYEYQSDDGFPVPGAAEAFALPQFGFQRAMMTSELVGDFGDDTAIGVSAVFAYQRFGTSTLGLQALDAPTGRWLSNAPSFTPYQESGMGTGVRLALRNEIRPGLSIDAGFQSRIDMEEFAAYRGVYSQPGDFDIPARASVGFALKTTEQGWVNVSVERVMYSDINAFPSTFLPDRFLSLLGDTSSPAFSWDDLTVYSVGWNWSNGEDTQWRLDFSSRAQPSPTSPTLAQALNGELADNAVTLGFTRRTGDRSRFAFNAAYAPAEYAFGGSVLGVTTDELDQGIEMEAYWTLDF